MPEQVKVRREHPSALSLAIALVLTMLCVYLITLSNTKNTSTSSVLADDGSPRATEEISFEPLSVWCVSFGTYDTAEAARIEAARYTSRGAAGLIRQDGGTYRVLAAGYASESDANRVAESLTKSEGVECSVYALSSERVRLRITASKSQITALRNAESAICTYAAELNDLAFQLDRSEIEADAARTLIAVMVNRVDEHLSALRAIPGASENAICSGLLTTIEQFRASLFVLSTENSVTALSLSGKIKYNYMEVILKHIEYLLALNS